MDMAKQKAKAKKKTGSIRKMTTRKVLSVSNKNSQDILNLLVLDHQPLKILIKILRDNKKDIKQRMTALDKFAALLINHAQAEERVLYSFMERDDDLREESFEGEVEHELAELMLESITQEKNHDMWSAKTKVLAELVEHHLKEEEKEAFADVKRKTSVADRIAMGANYLAFKEQYNFPVEQYEEDIEVTDSESDDEEYSSTPSATH
jgi:hemerythrin superfamily protein